MSEQLRIVADAHIWGVESAFSSLPGHRVELKVLECRDIRREVLSEADILLTRSSLRVDAALLASTAVRFVGTATIGDDHLDKPWLREHGIATANAAGSSTGSVLEYMLAALLDLHVRRRLFLPRLRLGVIGVGRIGSAVAAAAAGLGAEVMLNDPPRAEAEGAADFVDLETLMACSDVLTLHTPLTRTGPHSTWHLIGERELARFGGCGLINAARGGVVDNRALATWLDADAGRFAVLDCWEHEPDISERLLAHPQVVLATPHIAGHSLDGKAANTQFVYDALCRHLGVEPEWDMRDHLPPPEVAALEIPADGDAWLSLHRAVSSLYDIRADDARLRALGALPAAERRAAFVRLRRFYPVRRAWSWTCVNFLPCNAELRRLAAAVGLRAAIPALS